MAGELPFVIVYGGAIAKVAVVAVAGASFALVMRRRSRRERARTAQLVADAAKQVAGELAPGAGSIRGKLVGEATTVHGRESARSTRSDELALDVGGTRVELRGAVTVIRGTRAVAGYAVAAGDEVIARGVLAMQPSDGTADYRELAGHWVLEAAPEQTIEVIAASPASRPAALGPVRLAAIAALCGVLSYGALRVVGSCAVDHAESGISHEWGESRQRESIGTALELAAMMPHSRDAALENVATVLKGQMPRSEQVLGMRLELADLRGDCGARAWPLLEVERYAEAAEAARGCDDRHARYAAAIALAHLGRYDEAAPLVLPEPDRERAWTDREVIAVGAGRWADAATAFDQWADFWEAQHETFKVIEHPKLKARCLANWARAKAGDAAALARLREDSASATCRILAAWHDAKSADDLARSLNFVTGDSALVHELLWTLDPSFISVDNGIWALLDRYVSDEVLLARWRLEQHPDDAQRALLEIPNASLLALRGDTTAALAMLDDARATAVSDREIIAFSIEEVRTAILLHGPNLQLASTKPDTWIGDYVKLRDGTVGDLDLHAGRCTEEGHTALSAAAAGDGGPLAELLRRCDLVFMDEGIVLAVIPRVKDHRAELAAALRVASSRSGDDLDFVPVSFIMHAAMRRDIARLAGDDATAAAWQSIIEAQLRVLEDPDKLITFLAMK